MNANRRLFQRVDGEGRPIPGNTIIAKTMPKMGRWIDVASATCCMSPATIVTVPYATPLESTASTNYNLITQMVTNSGGATVATVPFTSTISGAVFTLTVAGVMSVNASGISGPVNISIPITFFTSTGAQEINTFTYSHS